MRYLWVNGRFGWPVITAVVFATLSALILDFVWRVVTIPINRLMTYAFVIGAISAALIVVGYQAIAHARERRS